MCVKKTKNKRKTCNISISVSNRSPVNKKNKKQKKLAVYGVHICVTQNKTKEKHKQNNSRCTIHSSTANQITKT